MYFSLKKETTVLHTFVLLVTRSSLVYSYMSDVQSDRSSLFLDDKTAFKIDCAEKECDWYPNTNGSCDTFISCMNGEKKVKRCNGGQLFDTRRAECVPKQYAACYQEPNAGSHTLPNLTFCPFHDRTASELVESYEDTTVIQNKPITKWGKWLGWENCPNGQYVTGLTLFKRMRHEGPKTDHAGLAGIHILCQDPRKLDESGTIRKQYAPGIKKFQVDKPPHMCHGAMVGFKMNIVKELPAGKDQISADNMKGYCSCSPPVQDEFKTANEQSGSRGTWMEEQNCAREFAICGMKTQMHEFKTNVIEGWDNTALNNVRLKCCRVPNPIELCSPEEKRAFVRTCNNKNGEGRLKCDFISEVGLSVDYKVSKNTIDFYSGIGYSLNTLTSSITTKIGDALKKSGGDSEYNWRRPSSSVFEDAVRTPHFLVVEPGQKVDLYQVVGSCDFFFIRTPKYIAKIKSEGGKVEEVEFEVSS